MKRVWLITGMVLGLVACEQTKTQDYYQAHPNEISTDLAECKRLGKNTYNCNEAARAQFLLQHPTR